MRLSIDSDTNNLYDHIYYRSVSAPTLSGRHELVWFRKIQNKLNESQTKNYLVVKRSTLKRFDQSGDAKCDSVRPTTSRCWRKAALEMCEHSSLLSLAGARADR